MRRPLLIAAITVSLACLGDSDGWCRGGRGGGGGGRMGGGGGARGGFSGGGVSRPGGFSGGGMSRPSGGAYRPSGGGGHSPSFSRPTPSPSRPSGVSRPSGGAGRPGTGSRPGGAGIAGGSGTAARPGTGTRPSTGGPATGRPSVQPSGDRPRISAYPGAGRPSVGGGAVAGNQPGLAGRPGSSARPGGGLGTAAGIGAAGGAGLVAGAGLVDRVGPGERPGAGQRPVGRPGPDGRPASLPGLGAGRPGEGDLGPGGDRLANRDVRRDDLQNRLAGRDDFRGDRFENRGDLQDDRQDFRGDRREDWQDWADDRDWVYHGWHHGYWHGYADGRWDHLWDEHPAAAALGLTAWGVNRAAYTFGLWGYVNPYYVEPYVVGTTVIDYSQPLIISEPYPVEVPVETPATRAESTPPAATQPLPPGVTQAGLDAFERARSAFYAGEYEQALRDIDQAAGEMPKDAAVHEFRGLILFALARYREAAAPAHAVLAVGPGWDWTTMVGLYPSVDVYTGQLRALERYTREHADDASSRFLLAYHYVTTGSTDAAIKRLREVVRLRPDDAVAAELIRMLAGPDEEPAADAATPRPEATPAETKPAAPPVDSEDLVGEWTAKGPKGSEYRVTFSADGSFAWNYAAGGKTEKVGGVYALDRDALAMEPDAGGTLAAEVSRPNPDTLRFAPAGAPAGDPGLNFARVGK